MPPRLALAAFALTSSLALLTTGCDCAGPSPGDPCMGSEDCAADQLCRDGLCELRPDGGGVDGGVEGDGGGGCTDGRGPCGGGCCDVGQVCSANVCVLDCGAAVLCAGACCTAGQECREGACADVCADPADQCGAACCGDDQACLSSACADLGDPCTLTEECEVDEICIPSLGRCAPRSSVEVCEFRPPVGEFSPRLGCQWRPPAGTYASYGDVVMTPAVMNLTDDNADGATDTLDIPDLVFVAMDRPVQGCCTPNGRLVIASGGCNVDGTMTTHAIIDGTNVDNSTGIALGNLHPDTMPGERAPEIVATQQGGRVIAWRRTADDGSAWAELWNVAALNASRTQSGAAPSLADLDADGQPEVIIGNVVLNGLTGALVWDGDVTVGTTAGVGNNAFLGPSSTVADLDLDGFPEVIAGNTVYDGRTGAERWSYTYTTSASPCHNGAVPDCDGYNGVGDFDDDPEGEIVIIRRGEVFVLNHDGTLLHQVTIPRDDVMPYQGNGPCANNESGPPTIADFDGDGEPEIGTAGADFYVVIDFECVGDPLPAECARLNVRWTVPNQDCSSRVTGSSVFDFEGDGAAEVVYADEVSFRIFAGTDGAVLYEDLTHRSNTRLEMPIVVDVDNDGKSEVVVPEPNEGAVNLGGIEILEDTDNNWVRTRRVWNQHAYHVTNITEDGQVPRIEERNWQNGRLNNFRQNVQPGGLFDAPDLQIESIVIAECIATGSLTIEVRVINRGALGVPPGIAVVARLQPLPAPATPIELGVQRTTRSLLPGQSETLTFSFDAGGPFPFADYTIEATVDDDGTGAGQYNECDEANNVSTSESFEVCSFG